MVAFITAEQAQELQGKTYDGVQYFSPVKNIDNVWCISEQEIVNCTNEDVSWVNELVADKEYKPKKINI
jgi:hypothetical protein